MTSNEQLPSYPTDSDGFLYTDKKPNSTPVPSTSRPVLDFPTPSYPSYYAPTPAPSAALTTHSTTTPLSFSRPRSQGPFLTYASFNPIFLLASSDKSTSLSKGFPMSPPPSKDDPHPFVSHDVNEFDWLQFLTDVQSAGSLTEKDISRSYIPIISWIPFIGGASVYGVQKFMKSRKYTTVARTLDLWNHHFFEPRKIRIVLMRGNERLSGLHGDAVQGLPPPDPVNVSSGMMDQAGAGNHKNGNKDGNDVYRLFVLSI